MTVEQRLRFRHLRPHRAGEAMGQRPGRIARKDAREVQAVERRRPGSSPESGDVHEGQKRKGAPLTEGPRASGPDREERGDLRTRRRARLR